MKELITIQTKLKAHKGQHNKFGNYDYRSLEDIVEALKPLMKETKTFLTMSDTIKEIAGRVYIVATATLHSEDGATTVDVEGWAREAQTQKGMSDAQVTGSTSTYARKYALNGLFAIDDTKDADSMDNSKEGGKVSQTQVTLLNTAIANYRVELPKFLVHFKISRLADMPANEYEKAMAMINKKGN